MQHSSNHGMIIWADVAKCICVVLVVLLHMENHIVISGWSHADDIIDFWHVINMFLRTIRLPMLFLISGMLSSASIMARLADVRRKYLIKPLYLYFLWATIFILIIPMYPTSDDTSLGLLERMRLVVLIASPAWYLPALASIALPR